jgi:hypothetical protein
MDTVTIRWHGPYRLDRIEYCDKSWDYGIYAIYQQFGNYPEKLLYIGLTQRSFVTRIREHCRDWLYTKRGIIRVRFGTLEFDGGQRFSKKKLDDVEALLIQVVGPPHNSEHTDYYRGRPLLTVHNVGRRGSIPKTVSTLSLVWE